MDLINSCLAPPVLHCSLVTAAVVFAGSPSSCSPPSFSFTGLEQRLRGEFSGDVSHFVAPPAVSQAEVGGASIVDGVLLPPTLF